MTFSIVEDVISDAEGIGPVLRDPMVGGDRGVHKKEDLIGHRVSFQTDLCRQRGRKGGRFVD